MKIIKSSLYQKQLEKLIQKKRLSRKAVEQTEEIFCANPNDHRLRPHTIVCKKDKRRRSITVIHYKAYRILYTDGGDVALFGQILHHDRCDRVNKDC